MVSSGHSNKYVCTDAVRSLASGTILNDAAEILSRVGYLGVEIG